jgi:hypothetical protein
VSCVHLLLVLPLLHLCAVCWSVHAGRSCEHNVSANWIMRRA